ncbi:unnamed protein product [Arabis nemorensis]|uniref:DNA-directed RNA polymerase III subunit RPC4 n=1 Tax=Arabis nemorensis TaxID=586526 RepID=A0A565AT65_9BRAS|nr:unnamed protein product [Arabis nemorensis]
MDSGSQIPRKSKVTFTDSISDLIQILPRNCVSLTFSPPFFSPQRRFQPRPPTPTTSLRPIASTSNTEAEEENRKAAKQLAKRIIGQGKQKTVKKASAEVAFQPYASSVGIKSFGVPKEDDKRDSHVKPSSSADILPTVSSATPQKDEEEVHTLVTRTKEDYIEPWDYVNSYYPTVLPLRKPNSGDPELCDQEEFGELAKHPEYDESTINSAKELGLTSQQHCKKQMFLFKIPDSLPVMKQLTAPNTKRSISDHISKRNSPFEGLSESFMGKMQVYKSGAVKLKLGDVLFDVSPGPKTKFHSDVAVIDDTKGRNCCRIGSSAKFATVTPDVESLLNSPSDMKTHR